jgi:hypothetical protein
MMICDICVTYEKKEAGWWRRWERVGAVGEAEENDKSDVEMKLPFFFHNLNTLSSPAAAAAAAMTLHFISHPSIFISRLTTRHALKFCLLPRKSAILSHLTLFFFIVIIITLLLPHFATNTRCFLARNSF